MASVNASPLSVLIPVHQSHSLRPFFLDLRSSRRYHCWSWKQSSLLRANAFYTNASPAAPWKERRDSSFDLDDISVLNERIRKELGKRDAYRSEDNTIDPVEAEKYMKMVKQQQQRGLQKLKGDALEGGFGYRVDPYTLQPGDYVVHKKVGVGRFVAIKYDVSKSSPEPTEYVFIEYTDGMAKLPVQQAYRMLYRYNLPNENKKPRALSKLNDTSAWERRKTKGKIAIQKMVVDLMELYLNRLKQKRPPYPKTSALAGFSAHFLYEPTQDQKQESPPSPLRVTYDQNLCDPPFEFQQG
ncbi:hypothetical protein AXF42_Ash014775 [Apostasia shenzhenica]|uniref:CarD-like/TRCF RNAP-interacting domain-containing protein n=1 Tax=Apostasia shenzhenica TaxID=1088818 RepID=A0A2H9ZW99_9ASPA|nr:hypothetical protein AXF42_Ash014775 [Apostasia shenzhenica]